jgi:hypothetical protein
MQHTPDAHLATPAAGRFAFGITPTTPVTDSTTDSMTDSETGELVDECPERDGDGICNCKRVTHKRVMRTFEWEYPLP